MLTPPVASNPCDTSGERVLRASRRRGVRSVDSGWTECGIDSRNRHVAEAELAPAPAKAAPPVCPRERLDAPPGSWTTSPPKGAYRLKLGVVRQIRSHERRFLHNISFADF